MPKEVSTPKQSGGGGYTFADKVAASYLLKMLAGSPPLDADSGQIQSVRFEKRVDGWFLDDIVLFVQRIDAERAAIAISIKSNAQLTDKGFPAEFTRAVWEQRLHTQTDQFDPATDYLALATSPLEIAVKSAWEALLTKAIDADPSQFADRIATAGYDNEIGRTIFNSLNCPTDVDSSRSASDTTTFLKRLRHIQFDFENNPSVDDNDCVARCRALLRTGGQRGANSLWASLKQIARSLATSGGDLTREELAKRLRGKFALNEFPNYEADWRKLSDDFKISVQRIREKLAGKLQISRTETSSWWLEKPLTALVGSSGSGKTVIAKHIAVRAAKLGHAIWLTPADLNQHGGSDLFFSLGIEHRFPELVAQSVGHHGLIVVDGIERLNQTGLANLAGILRLAGIERDASAWSFVFTCIADLWDSTFQALRREYEERLNVEVKTVEFSFNEHREAVVKAFPNMARMLLRPNLSPLFGNMKILDLVLSNANEDTNTATWVGESDILDWYWTQHIQQGPDSVARSRFCLKMACFEADEFLTAVPIDKFDSDECRLATGLQEDQVIWNREEQFGFEHDLLGDWARTRFLLSRKHEIAALVRERAINPRWHRAIRLYGLRLLENRDGGNEKWRELIAELSPDGKHKLESDLVLESAVFAAGAEQVLEQVWTQLIASSGALLARLLTRFLHVATLADPPYHRIPFWPVWVPLLRVLHAHRAEAITLATDQVTSIADAWLKYTGDNWPLRDEAAQLLLSATDHVIEAIQQKDWHVDDDLCKSVFCRFLTAATVRPDEVAESALSLVERREQSFFLDEEDKVTEEEGDQPQGGGIARLLGFGGPLGDPWPDGPLRRIQHEVHDGFLATSDPLQHLFVCRPDEAREVLLALLIREPMPKGSEAFSSPIDEFLHTETKLEWAPAMFFHGPFLTFLRTNWQKGIETIVALVNFVTDRWMDNRTPQPASVRATIDGQNVEYFGSSEAYYWYRDSVRSPNVVAPALMALERWLYLCLDEQEPIKEPIRQILLTSKSTALLGVLAAVGRKQPALFKEELRVLVPIWQLQVWEEKYRLEGLESLLGMTMMQWTRWGETVWNMVRDWHFLEHRKKTLGNVLFEQFITDSKVRSHMKSVQADWSQQLAALRGSEDEGFLEKIALRFDERNWRARPVENGVVVEFVEPEERTQRLAGVREEDELRLAVLTFPHQCRKLIDERKEMTPDQLAQFWNELHKISESAEQSRNSGEVPEHAVMGGIAVLTILHESWLNADADRERWCFEQFQKVLTDSPPHPQFHVAESISNYHWDNFAAMLIPRMLAELPAHVGIRSLCADFALAFNYSVIQDLMNSAFEYREILGDDFQRLQGLVLTSSGLRDVKTIVHGGNSIWGCPNVEFDIQTRFTELIEQFSKSETPVELPQLVAIAEEATSTIVEMVGRQHEMSYKEPRTEEVRTSINKRIKRCRGFEPFHIRAGFSWLEKIGTVKEVAERALLIDTLENLLHGFLRPLGGIEEALFDDEDDHTFFTVPGQWDTWIFDLIASVIPQLEESESAHRLWKPILSFGLDRVHWVDAFISTWFIRGLRVASCEENFFREWKAMIAYAWTRDNWRETAIRRHRSDDELFRHLMGFSGFGFGYLENENVRPFLASMKSEYDKWVDEFIPHPEAVSAFARFLTYPSAIDYLRDGVRRLADASQHFQEWHWRDHYHLDNALLRLLEHDWSKNSRLITKDAEIRRQFSTILKTMTDRQIPRALELQDKMIRAN